MGRTEIEWTHYSWQPGIYGCEEISPACAHCYAAKMAHRQVAMGNYPPGITTKRASGVHWSGKVETLAQPDTRGLPKRPRYGKRVFLTSMADVFHKNVSDGFIMNLWYIMAHRHDLTFLVLTKRPERMAAFLAKWADTSGDDEPKLARGADEIRAQHTSGRARLFADMIERWGEPPSGCAPPSYDWAEGPRRWPTVLPNVWLGTTVEDQARANERIPYLLRCPAAMRFLSCEPLLGPVDLRNLPTSRGALLDALTCDVKTSTQEVIAGPPIGVGPVSWVISGGESGHGARPTHPDWARSLRDQCQSAGVPFFWKQHGDLLPACQATEEAQKVRPVEHQSPHTQGKVNVYYRPGKAVAGRLLDGVEHSAFPKVTP